MVKVRSKLSRRREMRNVEDLRFHVMGKEKMDQATAIGTRSQRTSRKRTASTT